MASASIYRTLDGEFKEAFHFYKSIFVGEHLYVGTS
jgi:hypothetical protein